MKTRTNQPVYKDNGTLLTDEDLGGGGGHAYHLALSSGYTAIYLSPNDNLTKEQIQNEIKENGFTSKDNALPITLYPYIVANQKKIVLAYALHAVGSVLYVDSIEIKLDYTAQTISQTFTTSSVTINTLTKIF